MHVESPLAKARPAGVVVIVIVYWAMALPQLAAWHDSLTVVLHTAITAVTVQLGLRTSRFLKVVPGAMATGFGVTRSAVQARLRHS